MTNTWPRSFRGRGFSLVELLVVMGIIAILLALLIPVVAKVRMQVYKTDTAQEINQIMSACNAYYATFHAYPGPFSNDQIEAGTLGSPSGINMEIYSETAQSYSAPAAPWKASPWFVTGSENLVLGLMGGLRWNSGNSLPAFAPAEVGLGPLNLNPLNPQRTSSFFSAGTASTGYLTWCQETPDGTVFVQGTQYQPADTPVPFFDQTGVGQVANLQAGHQINGAPIPEFVDRFPSPGPMPILYLRARTGARGIINDGTTYTDPSTGKVAAYQYDIREIAGYILSSGGNPNNLGLPPLDPTLPTYRHGLQAVGSFPAAGTYPPLSYVPPFPPPSNTSQFPFPDDAGQYFMNPAVTPTQQTTQQGINYSGQPRAVDQFILISAGPDGVYGTADDITSFGDVMP